MKFKNKTKKYLVVLQLTTVFLKGQKKIIFLQEKHLELQMEFFGICGFI